MKIERKKRGKSKNAFDSYELQRYYDEIQMCFKCSQYNATDFHHNVSCKYEHTSSLLNAVPICKTCHADDSTYFSKETQMVFFEKVVRHLIPLGYKFNETDVSYVNSNDHLHPVLQSLLLNDKL